MIRVDISIHAPRGGSDNATAVPSLPPPQISIHAPRGGSDTMQSCMAIMLWVFLSTLPVGGATGCKCNYCLYSVISIHAPRGGSDTT